MLAIKAKAIKTYVAMESFFADLFADKNIVKFEGSGATVVFAVKSLNQVFKVPTRDGLKFFQIELDAIRNAEFAHDLGYVYAAITTANAEMIRQIPKKCNALCGVGDPIVSMPLLSGTTALEALYTKKIDTQIIARAIVDHVAKLQGHQWYNTDLKLENIQLTDDGRVVFLDWGSLCKKDSNCPTATFAVIGHTTCPRTCGSLAAVLTLAELFKLPIPDDRKLSEGVYLDLREEVLGKLENPHDHRLRQNTINAF
ncbi:MAG: hypothetical protein CL678_17615 [Bdellovibrionaceae bacterium]|nr:hypothetical protein [Pseudobdellovibrionaceae bacterium]|tara:strand:- start:1033 stop:1797 length:765 start_codon:yes stop_codon:yes gene_type:complete